MQSKEKLHRCTSAWITFFKVTFAMPCWVSTTGNNHLLSSPHCFLTLVKFSFIFQAASHLIQIISLSNFIIKNLSIFSTSPIAYIFREPMPLVLPSQQKFYTFFFFFFFILQVVWPTFDFKESCSFRAAPYFHYTKMQSLWKWIELSNTLHS